MSKQAESTLEPFKIVGRLIAAVKDEDGNVIGEKPVAEMVIYAPQFNDLQQRVEETWPQVVAEHQK